MTKIAMTLRFLAAGLIAGSACAQTTNGEATPPEQPILDAIHARSKMKAQPDEMRTEMGAPAAAPANGTNPMTMRYTKEERRAAALKRRAETAAAVRNGEIPHGEF
jgi:hypothetical protein